MFYELIPSRKMPGTPVLLYGLNSWPSEVAAMEKTGGRLGSVALTALSASIVILALSIMWMSLSLGNTQTTQVPEMKVEDTLAVIGNAEVTAVPDLLTINFIIQRRGATPSEALSLLSSAVQTVVDAVLREGVVRDEVRTAGLNIMPEYVYREGQPPAVTGYIASYVLEVKTKNIEKAGELITAAVNAGADQVGSMFLSLSKEKDMAVYQQLLTSAVENARSKASALLEPLGMKIVRVKSVSIADYRPIPIRGDMPVSGETAGPPVMPGTTTISVSVNVVFVIAPR